MSSLPVIAPDHSHYQHELDGSFTRGFDIFKCTQGTTYLDSKWDVNASVAASLYQQRRLAGAVAYHVFTGEDPAAQFRKIVAAISRGGPPPMWLAGVMIDLESWAGTSYELHGDHSTNINRLGGMLAGWLKSWRATWLYANDYDRSSLAPRRDLRLPFHLAAYTSELRFRTIKGAIGQQYSDGESKWSVPTINGAQLPRSSSPFGNCDHNVFPAFATATALREWMRPTEEDDGMATITQAQFNTLFAGLPDGALDRQIEHYLEAKDKDGQSGYAKLWSRMSMRLRGDHAAAQEAASHSKPADETNLAASMNHSVRDSGI